MGVTVATARTRFHVQKCWKPTQLNRAGTVVQHDGLVRSSGEGTGAMVAFLVGARRDLFKSCEDISLRGAAVQRLLVILLVATVQVGCGGRLFIDDDFVNGAGGGNGAPCGNT